MSHARVQNSRRSAPALASAALLFAAACGPSTESVITAQDPGAQPKVSVAARVHAHSPRLDRLRAALDRGALDEAQEYSDAAENAGAEAPLLRARLLALTPAGTLEALRLLENARTQSPLDPDVYATAAEIYAGTGAFDTAWSEIERGVKACGEAAEFSRARGIVWIARENGARRGLEHLEKARAIDPDLPFTDRALAQAHLLVAKLEMQAQKKKRALEHARLSLNFDPTDVDARRLLADLYAEALDFTAAIALIEGLVQEGRPLRGELAALHKKAGVAALLERDRARALEHFVAARENGMNATDLASGTHVLEDESRARTQLGLQAYEEGRYAAAEENFRAAVRFDPESLAPRNHLAVVYYRAQQYLPAAELWRGVLSDAEKSGVELPDPVHLNLASALKAAGEQGEARAVVDEYLKLHPTGVWRDQTTRFAESLETPR
ncbi:MAG: hypothetical protein JNL28_13050 [Planctomycetes bacterium]|nr:hypothetical protein [Planctomycetota bacterium]